MTPRFIIGAALILGFVLWALAVSTVFSFAVGVP